MRGVGLFCDLDGTIGRNHSMPDLYHDLAKGVAKEGKAFREVKKRFRDYHYRMGSFREYEKAIVPAFQEMLRGRKVAAVQRRAETLAKKNSRIVYVFARELLRAARELEIPCFLISGGPEPLVTAVGKRLKCTECLCSAYPHKDGVYTGEAPEYWMGRKHEGVALLARKHGIDLSRSIAIGDSISDLGMLKLVRWPICFNPSAELRKDSDAYECRMPHVVERKDTVYIYVAKSHSREMRHEGGLHDILPAPLVSELQLRLMEVGYL